MHLAYAAGVFDGEGCVNFSRVRHGYSIRVFIANTDRNLLEAFRTKFGGDIGPLSLRRPGWKQGWQWRISWSRAIDFLDAISPWLRVKRQQAQVAFAWDAIRGGRGRPADTETMSLLRDQLKWLNRKGDAIAIDPVTIA